MKYIAKITVFISLAMLSTLSMGSDPSKALAKNAELDDQYQALVSLFFDAARIGNNEVIKTFVSAGFPINERNAQSYTALMVAAYQGQKETVKVLLNEGANPCLEDKRGNTAFLGALLKREVQIARTLYQADCRYEDSRNKAGLNVKEFAELFGQAEVLNSFTKTSN